MIYLLYSNYFPYVKLGNVTDEEVKRRELKLRDALKNDEQFQVKEGALVEVAQVRSLSLPLSLWGKRVREVSVILPRRNSSTETVQIAYFKNVNLIQTWLLFCSITHHSRSHLLVAMRLLWKLKGGKNRLDSTSMLILRFLYGTIEEELLVYMCSHILYICKT